MIPREQATLVRTRVCRWRWRRGHGLRLVFLLTAGASLCLGAGNSALVWEGTEQALTAVPDQREVQTSFAYRNVGAHPVRITSVTTSCGCTTGVLPSKACGPGESGTLDVVFTVGDRTGLQEKVLTVATDEAGISPTELALRVTIREYVELSQRWVVWKQGDVASGKAITFTASVAPSFNLTKATCPNPAFTARVETVAPGRQYLLHLSPASTSKPESAVIAAQLEMEGVGTRILYVYCFVK